MDLLQGILAMAAYCLIWGFFFSWAADKDEKEFQEYLNGITAQGEQQEQKGNV